MPVTLVYPIVAWGTPEDFTGWTASGCTVGTAAADPFGGTLGYLLTDTTAIANGSIVSGSVDCATASAVNPITAQVFVKAGTSAESSIELTIVSGPGTQALLTIEWSGGVPTAYISGVHATDAATALTPVALEGGWYIVGLTVYPTASGNHQLTITPDAGAAAGVGTMYVYAAAFALLDVLDNPVAWTEPREGSAWVTSPSGVEDAWIVGTDYHFQGTARWIPARAANDPVRVSGWDGAAEATWANQGVNAMVRAGQDKTILYVAPSRAVSSAMVGSYLVEWPTPSLEPNGLRSLPLHLRNPTAAYEGWVA